MARGRGLRDQRGLALSTSSPAAAERYVEALERLLSFDAGAELSLGEAIQVDDAFALAHGALAYIDHVQGRVDAAKAGVERASSLVGGISRPEQQHVAVITALVGGHAPLVDPKLVDPIFRFGVILRHVRGIGLVEFADSWRDVSVRYVVYEVEGHCPPI